MSIYSQVGSGGGSGPSSITINTPSGTATSADGSFTFAEDGTTTISATGSTVSFSSSGSSPTFSNAMFAVTAEPSNVTGDGTNYQIVFDQITFQTGSAISMDTSTGQMTVNVSGYYLLAWNLTINNVSVANTLLQANINLGATVIDKTGVCFIDNPGAHYQATEWTGVTYSGSQIAQLVAGDLFQCEVEVGGGTKSIGLPYLGPNNGYLNSFSYSLLQPT